MSAITIKEREALACAGIPPRRRMEKKLDDLRIHVDEQLKLALMEFAYLDDRALSDFARRVLQQYVDLRKAGVSVFMVPQRSGEAEQGEAAKRDD